MQLRPRTSPGETLKHIEKFVAKLLNADALVLPANAPADPRRTDARIYAEEIARPGTWLRGVAKIALEYGVWVFAPFYEAWEGKLYNSAAVFSPNADLVALYREFNPLKHVHENISFATGALLPPVVELKGVRVGLLLCCDLYSPEIARLAMIRGADAIVVPLPTIPIQTKSVVHALAQARAVENSVYIITASLSEENSSSCSMVVNPLGMLELILERGETYAEYTIDSQKVSKARLLLQLRTDQNVKFYCENACKLIQQRNTPREDGNKV